MNRLLQTVRDLLEEANRQGTDTMGYVHYVERVRFDLVEHELTKYCRKHGDYRWIPQQAHTRHNKK